MLNLRKKNVYMQIESANCIDDLISKKIALYLHLHFKIALLIQDCSSESEKRMCILRYLQFYFELLLHCFR